MIPQSLRHRLAQRSLFLRYMQTDGQLQSQMVYLRHDKTLVQRKSSSPRNGLIPEHPCLYPPRRYVTLLFPHSRPHSQTALHRGHFLMQIQRGRARDDIKLLVYPGISPFIGLATPSSAHARHSNPRQHLPNIIPHILVSIALTK